MKLFNGKYPKLFLRTMKYKEAKEFQKMLKKSSYVKNSQAEKERPKSACQMIEYYDKRKNIVPPGTKMVLHGTIFSKAEAILRDGCFKNSPSGYFGPGVYNTQCFDLARFHALRKKMQSSNSNNVRQIAIIVSEVHCDVEPMVEVYKNYWRKKNKTEPLVDSPFVYFKNSKGPVNLDDDDEEYEGRMFRTRPFLQNELCDEVLVQNSLIVPRYVLSVETKNILEQKEINFFNRESKDL